MRPFLYFKITILLSLLMLLPGCWSSIDIQNQHYVTSLGIDYDGENYLVYAQIVRFENVARVDSQGGGSPINTYVGTGKGSTLNTASSDLYNTAQVRIEWGHTKAVVASYRAMLSHDSELVEHIYRFPENRYNTWLYVTEESIEDIFLTNSFYDRTSLFSILHMPMSSHKQSSTVPPIEMFKYLSIVNEPDRITVIPVIGTDKEQWKSNKGELKLLTINGGYFEAFNGVKKLFPKEQLKGVGWLDPRLSRTMLIVEDEKKKYAVLSIDRSKVKKRAKLVNGEVKFTVKANFKGMMNEYINEIDYHKMIELAKEQIKKEIMDSYLLGVKEEIDFMNFMHAFRMKDPAAWKRMTDNGQKFILDEHSIENLDIELIIPFNGKYKRET